MAYTLTNLQDDIRSYTEVSSTVLSSSVLDTIIKNSQSNRYRPKCILRYIKFNYW